MLEGLRGEPRASRGAECCTEAIQRLCPFRVRASRGEKRGGGDKGRFSLVERALIEEQATEMELGRRMLQWLTVGGMPLQLLTQQGRRLRIQFPGT